MGSIPQLPGFDHSLAFAMDPYEFVSSRARRLGSDVFLTRLMLKPTICMTGAESAHLFYDPERFERNGAAPARIQKTLFGEGGVQGLDGAAHRHRKAMFLSLMTPEAIGRAGALARETMLERARRHWTTSDRIEFYPEIQRILTLTACAMAAVPLHEPKVELRTRELVAMFNYAASFGPKHWWSRAARKQGDQWIGEVIGDIRAGRQAAPEDSPAAVVARHRNLDGELLGERVAAVELLNVLRPIVAVSAFVVFAAHALHAHPECAERIRDGGGEGDSEDPYLEWFVQEVRRLYPFFPTAVARVREDFEWNGWHFPAGTRTALDLYGTNRDPRTWERPDDFRPERFRDWDGSAFNFIPQGGGDPQLNHRCPGERMTVELMKVAVDVLARRLRYDVPDQDLSLPHSRQPAVPPDGFLMSNVRIVE